MSEILTRDDVKRYRSSFVDADDVRQLIRSHLATLDALDTALEALRLYANLGAYEGYGGHAARAALATVATQQGREQEVQDEDRSEDDEMPPADDVAHWMRPAAVPYRRGWCDECYTVFEHGEQAYRARVLCPPDVPTWLCGDCYAKRLAATRTPDAAGE